MTDTAATDRHSSGRRGQGRRWVALVAVVLAVILVGGVAVWQSVSRPASAEDAARAYLRALESGEASEVEATGIEVSDTTMQAFVAAESPVTEAAVVSVDETGSTATARVSFVLDDATHDADISLVLRDGRWTPDSSGLARLSVSTTVGTSVSIGEAVFDASEAISLLPAAYVLAAAPNAYLSGKVDVVALPGTDEEVTVSATLQPGAVDAAQQHLDALLAGCAAETTLPAEGCGIRIPWGTDFRAVDEVAFRIETLPTVALSDDGAAFVASGGELIATLSGTGRDGAARTTTYRSENWAVRGDVAFAGNEMTLTVW